MVAARRYLKRFVRVPGDPTARMAMASSDIPASPLRRRPSPARRSLILLWAASGLLISACATSSHPGATAPVCYLVLENQTDYTWEIFAEPVTAQAREDGLNWRVAPATAITVELAAPQPWRLTQQLAVNGTFRTTDFAGEAGVTYRWPLATLHSFEPAP